MAETIGGAIGAFLSYIILVVVFAYAGALAGIIIGLATSNVLFGGMALTTIFAWAGVGLAHIAFIYAAKRSIDAYEEAKQVEAIIASMSESEDR